MTTDWGSEEKGRCLVLALMAASVLVLAACGGSDDDGAGQERTIAAIDAVATPPAAAELLGVTWTTAVDPETRVPKNEVTSFPNDAPAIIAAVEVGEVQAGTELTATWSIDGVEVPKASMRVTAQQDLQEGWATFQFTRDPARLFPLGELEVRVTAPGDDAVTATVDIVLPEN
ncbi:MAG TPA: hypothetical protein VGR29_09955 [Thermomicrobiales bacterium]|nr:hypothetical protein [Thermomicrobiales bacterium]